MTAWSRVVSCAEVSAVMNLRQSRLSSLLHCHVAKIAIAHPTGYASHNHPERLPMLNCTANGKAQPFAMSNITSLCVKPPV